MSLAVDINRGGIHRLLVEKRHPDGFYLTVMFHEYKHPSDFPAYFHPLAIHVTQAELEQMAWGIAELPGSTMYDEQDAPGEATAGEVDHRQLELANVAQNANGG